MKRLPLALLVVIAVASISGCYAGPRGYYGYGPSRVVVVHHRHWRR
jgi:hypothetical protein